MKFTAFAILSCAIASVAALPAPGTNGDLATRGLRQKAHDIHQIWKDASMKKDELENQEDAIEHARNQKIKAAIFGTPNAKRDPGFHPIEAVKTAWRNHKAEEALEDENDKAVKTLKKTDRKAAKDLKKQNELNEDALENEQKGTVWATLWGKNKPQQGQKATVKDGQVVAKRTVGESWTAWRKSSASEDDLEKTHKEQREKLEAQMKELKKTQKEEMKTLKATNWAATKKAFWQKKGDKATESEVEMSNFAASKEQN